MFYRQEVEEFFNYMDRDYDGRLSFEEFMGEECTIEKLFKNMDKNGDGFVSKQVNSSENIFTFMMRFIKYSENFIQENKIKFQSYTRN